VTKYRKKLLRGVLVDDVKQKIFDIAQKYGYHIVAMESDQDHIHILLDYDTTYSVANIVKQIKQETTYYAWKKYSVFLEKHDWKKKILWSDGYFACSIGEVSSETIKRYIEQQG
jgi:putative transposase